MHDGAGKGNNGETDALLYSCFSSEEQHLGRSGEAKNIYELTSSRQWWPGQSSQQLPWGPQEEAAKLPDPAWVYVLASLVAVCPSVSEKAEELKAKKK